MIGNTKSGCKVRSHLRFLLRFVVQFSIFERCDRMDYRWISLMNDFDTNIRTCKSIRLHPEEQGIAQKLQQKSPV